MRFYTRRLRGRVIFISLTVFFFVKLSAYSLPKNQPVSATETAESKKAVFAQKAQEIPIPLLGSQRLQNINLAMPFSPGYRVGGVSRVLSAGVPYVDVRVGTTEVPSNNHEGRTIRVSDNGVVHMIYEVMDADPDDIIRSPADSNTNGIYFYNAYDCGNSNGLRNGSKDVEMQKVFTGIDDDRPRKLYGRGGIILPGAGHTVPIAFGQRALLRTDLPGAGRYDDSPWGWNTMKDAAQCQALFGMDTSYTDRDVGDPIMHAVNESTWVVTFADVANSNIVRFSYTTDRGLSWAAKTMLPTYTPWWNALEIASNGNTFYIVSMTDPGVPNSFQSSERPVYLKGTYNPATGAITFGAMQDIPANAGWAEYNFLGNMLDIAATMVGDTLHVAWTDWNDWLGQDVPGPGGHVHHAAVRPDGTVPWIQKVADINIDGRLPKITTTAFGFGVEPWGQIELSYDAVNTRLYCLWSRPPDDGNYDWADYEVTRTLANFDIFCSASPNNGLGWDESQNVTQTNNPDCDGSVGNPCGHEYWFTADDRVVNDTIWIGANVKMYPGFQESAVRAGITPDVGPITERRDIFRLYKAPARAPVLSARGALGSVPGDTVNPYALYLKPGGAAFTMTLRLSNIGLLGFITDSIKIGAGLNDGFLATYTDWSSGNPVPVGGFYDFHLSFDPWGVNPAVIGARVGDIRVYVHSVSPTSNQQIGQGIQVFVVPTLCLNRKIRIHSGTNYTDIGSQGTIKDGSGAGLHEGYESPGGIDRVHDGGIWIANSALNAIEGVSGVPRKVSRQLFRDKFLRCIADIVMDSVPGTGPYYNLYAKSVATDVEDSTLIWETIWEQSTDPDSSDFLLQTVQVANIGDYPIDSVALGVAYDIDVTSSISSPTRNVSGDTSVNYAGRKFWLGWTAGPDVTIDSCSPNNEFYGALVIPNGIGNPGDSIHPRGAAMYHQAGFSYKIGNDDVGGGDSLAQRYSWNLDVSTSTSRRTHDSLTGVWQDTITGYPLTVCNADPNNGAPYRNDEGYMAIAKKVYNFPVNQILQNSVSRYGLTELASSIDDSTMPGPKETFTVIHVASAAGLAQLMANAVKGIDWYVKHANIQVGGDMLGSNSCALSRADMNGNASLDPNDVILLLSCAYLGSNCPPLRKGDLNCDGVRDATDVMLLLQAAFAAVCCPCPLSPPTIPDWRDSVIIESKTVTPGTGSPVTTVKVWVTNKDSITNLTLPLEIKTASGNGFTILSRPRTFSGTIIRQTTTLGSNLTFAPRSNSVSPDSATWVGFFDPTNPAASIEPPNVSRKLFWEIKFDTVNGASGQVILDAIRILDNVVQFTGTSCQHRIPVNFVPGVVTIQELVDAVHFDIPPTLPCGSSFPVNVGSKVELPIQASNVNLSKVVQLSAPNVPAGATFFSTPGNPAVGTFRWAPATPGNYTVTFTAKNSDGSNEVSCSYDVKVQPEPPCPSSQLASLAVLMSSSGPKKNILKFNTGCSFTQPISSSSMGDLAQMVVTSNGNIFVADPFNKLHQFSGTGLPLRSPILNPNLNAPWGMAMSPVDSSKIYVTNHNAPQILVFDTAGNYINTISGDVPSSPSGIAIGGPNNNIFVTGGPINNVQLAELNYSGQLVRLLSTSGTLQGNYVGLAFRPGGNLYAASELNNSIVEFNPSQPSPFVRSISHPSLSGPRGVSFAPNGDMYVASSGNDRVLIFHIPDFINPDSCGGSGLLSSPSHVAFLLSPKGDLNEDRTLTPSDVVLELNCIFLGIPPTLGDCTCDLDCNDETSPADVVLELLAAFLGQPFPCN